jgi:hypothetical protein
MTRPTAAPEPLNCSTNQSKAMMMNWSPRYEMLSPAKAAGTRYGAMERKQQRFAPLADDRPVCLQLVEPVVVDG